MFKSSPCSVSSAHETLLGGCCSSFRAAAPSAKLFPQGHLTVLLYFESSQNSGQARRRRSSTSSNRESVSLSVSNLKAVSRPNRLKGRFEIGVSYIDGRKSTRRTPVLKASRDDKRGGFPNGEDLSLPNILETVTLQVQGGGSTKDDVVEVQVENLGDNSRKIVAKITIEAPLDTVWAILTDYEHLADFFPGLAVNELLEKRHNGARLYQVGEQNIAFGVKFKAKAVVDCKETPTTVHEGYIRRDIDFENVEGDFQIFRGTWRMEQPHMPSTTTSVSSSAAQGAGQKLITVLSYIVVVQPRIWLPVALVEGRLTSEMKTNLLCIRERSRYPSLR